MIRVALQKVARPLASNYTPRFTIANWKMPSFEIDPAGISGFLDASTETHLTLGQKLAEFSVKSLYHGFDEWTRQLLMTLSLDLNVGFATSIVIATIIIKTIFLYPTLKGQLMGLRQKELKGMTDQYKEKMKIAQMTRNKFLMNQATYEYKLSMKKKGINNLVPMLNFVQIPILVTWFLSLRYMSNLPEIYPQLLTDGYLWFTDLSSYDPYFTLPVLAACVTSFSIVRSPNLSRNNVTLPFLAPYVKYMKFLPFASLAFTSFFPASINLYWLTLAGYQLMITQLMYSKWVRKNLGGHRKQYIQQSKVQPVLFVSEKQTSEAVMKSAEEAKKKSKEESTEGTTKKGQQNVKTVGIKSTPPIDSLNVSTIKLLKKKPKKEKTTDI